MRLTSRSANVIYWFLWSLRRLVIVFGIFWSALGAALGLWGSAAFFVIFSLVMLLTRLHADAHLRQWLDDRLQETK